ncbi:MAG: TRAP transporter substrate-binding protein DctP [Desulfobacteraceae bacterium]|jgi:TRAP-type C4-dicarboxylate transport system substrate-binding protein|nr:TRAP transporter substrate-binding protein DctP [Desulfobacteraceae bacterium]
MPLKPFALVLAILTLTTAAIVVPAGEASAVTTIKIALVTPEGSTWTETLHRFARDVTDETGGEVQFQIYAGGVSGDELDVLRKMRSNRIHAAGFSGVGLGILLPEIRILEAPLLFRSYAEVDHVKAALYDRFAQGLEKKGFVLLGFAEAGFVYFFSEPDPSAPGALQEIRMWSWKGDPVAQTFLETFGIPTVPLHLADVNTGLETGMINAFYSPPLAAVAFQWYTRIRYMMDYPMVNSTGALLISRRTFQQLSPENQRILKDLARRYCRELVELTRTENREAVAVLKESGIRLVTPAPEQVKSFEENARKTYEKHTGELYSADLFQRVQSLLKDFRTSRGQNASP